MSHYQKGKPNLDFTEVRGSEWQWHQLGHMQVCTLLQTDNHAKISMCCRKKFHIVYWLQCRDKGFVFSFSHFSFSLFSFFLTEIICGYTAETVIHCLRHTKPTVTFRPHIMHDTKMRPFSYMAVLFVCVTQNCPHGRPTTRHLINLDLLST